MMRTIPFKLFVILIIFSITAGCQRKTLNIDSISKHAEQNILRLYPDCEGEEVISVLDSGGWHKQTITLLNEDPDTVYIRVLTRHDEFESPDGFIFDQAIEWIQGPWEGNIALLNVTAWKATDRSVRDTLWTMSDERDTGKINQGFYESQLYGCCDAWTVSYLHNRQSGRFVMSYDDTLIALSKESGPGNYPDRYIGILSQGGSYMESNTDTTLVSRVFYASEEGVMSAIGIRILDIESFYVGDCDWPIYYIRSVSSIITQDSVLTEMSINPANILATSDKIESLEPRSLCYLRMSFDCNKPFAVIIPILKDDFLLEKTKFKNLEIVRIK